jgi:nicotinamide-nucleotide amidase
MEYNKNVWVDILSIGDELLIGQTVNTNASWLGAQCNQHGLRVRRVISIPDQQEDILREIETSMREAQVTLVTGGLGPTKDDITKKTIAHFFQDELVRDIETQDRVNQFFALRNLPVLASNDGQSMVPSKCDVIPNLHGTAPGMWFQHNGHILVSMPGVPYEMKGIMENFVWDKIQNTFSLPNIIHRTIMTIGVGESFLAEKLATFEDEIGPAEIALAYLPSPGCVKLRLSSYGNWDNEAAQKKMDEFVEKMHLLIGDYIFSDVETTIYQVIAQYCRQSKKTLSVAESCTGGTLQSILTQEPGASDYFKGGITSYWTETKIDILHVDESTILKNKVVSEAVATEMAENCRKMFNSDFAIATTGYAGPTSDDLDIPVGTIYIAVSNGQNTFSRTLKLGTNRVRNIQNACLQAANLLRSNYFNN